MIKWIKEDAVSWYPISGDTKIYDSPGLGIFQLFKNPNPQDGRLGLRKIGDKFEFNFKLYGLGNEDVQNRIIGTWNSEYFKKKGNNLGVILNGTKGTGKTIYAKQLCNMLNIPVIVVPYYIRGILEFIQNLEFEAVVLIDEAEKTFCDDDEDNSSQILLKLIDGVHSKSRKLYILTTNTLSVNENLLSRPGRISYIKEFSNLPAETVLEYVSENLIDKSKTDGVIKLVDRLDISTIDILRFLVDEVNIHGNIDDVNLFNINIRPFTYECVLLYNFGTQAKVYDYAINKLRHNKANFTNWFFGKLSKKEAEELIALNPTSEFITESTTWYDVFYFYWDAEIKTINTKSTIGPGYKVAYNTIVKVEGDLCRLNSDTKVAILTGSRKEPSLYEGRLVL